MIFNRHEGFFGLTNIALFVPGIVMVFTVAGWKWGLGGLVLYWLLVSLVLMPIVSKRFFSFESESELGRLGRMDSGAEAAKMKEGLPTVEGQVRAAMAACIATEIKSGRDPEVAKAMCYEMIKSHIARGSHPREGK